MRASCVVSIGTFQTSWEPAADDALASQPIPIPRRASLSLSLSLLSHIAIICLCVLRMCTNHSNLFPKGKKGILFPSSFFFFLSFVLSFVLSFSQKTFHDWLKLVERWACARRPPPSNIHPTTATVTMMMNNKYTTSKAKRLQREMHSFIHVHKGDAAARKERKKEREKKHSKNTLSCSLSLFSLTSLF